MQHLTLSSIAVRSFNVKSDFLTGVTDYKFRATTSSFKSVNVNSCSVVYKITQKLSEVVDYTLSIYVSHEASDMRSCVSSQRDIIKLSSDKNVHRDNYSLIKICFLMWHFFLVNPFCWNVKRLRMGANQ